MATTVLVLRSSSTPIHATLPPDRDSPVRQPPSPGRRPPSEDSVVRLDDGIIGMDAPKSLELETPGAMITLSGRCDGDSGREGKYSSKHHEHGRTSAKVCAQGDRGRLSADADVVEIFGTSPAGVTIAAGGVGGTTTQLGHTEEARQRHSETMTGGRIEVISNASY